MENNDRPKIRSAYSTPELRTYGGISNLTRSTKGSSSTTDSNPHGSNSKTS